MAYEGKKAVVIGAGPAGVVAAGFLVEQGFHVKVFEQREDPSAVDSSTLRSYSVVLKPSSIDILKRLGVQLPPESGGFFEGLHRFKGLVVYSPEGKRFPGTRMHRFAVLGLRSNIIKRIMTDLKQQHLERLSFYFNHTCTNVSFENRKATFWNAEEERREEEFDLLIGADGANSVVRKYLEEYDKDFSVEFIKHDYCYKAVRSLQVPSVEGILSDSIIPEYPVRVIFYQSKFRGKRGPVFMVYILDETGGVQALITGPKSGFDGIDGYEETWAEAYLPKYFPHDWKMEIARQMKEGTVMRVPHFCNVSKMVGEKTVLLGDAAHSGTPALGIGCNMAINDSGVLNEALKTAKGDIDTALKLFNQWRYPVIQDIQNLKTSVVGQRLELPVTRWHWPLFGGLHYLLYSVGHRFLPSLVPPSAYVRFSEEEISARQAVNELKRVGWSCMGLIFAVMLYVVWKATV